MVDLLAPSPTHLKISSLHGRLAWVLEVLFSTISDIVENRTSVLEVETVTHDYEYNDVTSNGQ